MSLPGLPEGLTRTLGQRPSLSAMVTVAVVGGLLFVILVSLFGSSDDAEPRQVLKIEHAPAVGVGGPASPGPLDAAAAGAMSLVAVNGVVISDPSLIEMVVEGPLPKIADDGRKAMDVYARAYDRSDPRPKIAIVVGGLGLGEAVTQAAVDRLPAGVTLAVTPYGSALQALVSAARAKGHEVLLEVPLEPYDYPDNDPGQDTLLTGETAAENPARLRRVLGKVTGYAGLINSQGSKFLASETEVRELLNTTSGRGLYFVDDGGAETSRARDVAQISGAPFVRSDRQVDREPTQKAIETAFAALEETAKQRGSAIGIASAFPVTVDRVQVWAETLEGKGIALVPVSALVEGRAIVAPAPTVRAPPQALPNASPPKVNNGSSAAPPRAARRTTPTRTTSTRTSTRTTPTRTRRSAPAPAASAPADPAPVVLPTDPQPFEPSAEPAAPHP